jgi:hypothetical protein
MEIRDSLLIVGRNVWSRARLNPNAWLSTGVAMDGKAPPLDQLGILSIDAGRAVCLAVDRAAEIWMAA